MLGWHGHSHRSQRCNNWAGAILNGAQNATQAVIDDAHGDEVREVSRNLFSLLAQRTRGKAHTLIRLIGPLAANGLEGWR